MGQFAGQEEVSQKKQAGNEKQDGNEMKDGNEKQNGNEEVEISEMSEVLEIIDKLDIEEEDKQRIYACILEEEFKGPLPHPAILKQYEEIYAGFAKEIMQMAENEQRHRHDVEKMIVKSQTSLTDGQLEMVKASVKLKTRLQMFGFLCTILLMGIGAACIFLDKNVGSIVPFVLAIGSFCWTMFYGKKDSSAESDDKEEE